MVFTGYVYGDEVHTLMKHAYTYVQASDVEGLSPVLLEVMALGTPVICSDIPENLYAVEDAALTFSKSDADDLRAMMEFALANPSVLDENAARAQRRTLDRFSWDRVTDEHVALFERE